MIDLHAHVVLEETLGAAGRYGPTLEEGDPATARPPRFCVGDYELVGVSYRGTAFMDPELRLAEMDRRGIDLQVLSPNPLTFLSHIESAEATAFARRQNDAVAALVATEPTRLRGFTQVPIQDPDAAIEELRRATRDLGLVAPYIGTDVGRALDDPDLDRFYAECVELDVPLFIHPAPDGIDSPRRDERLARFDGDLWLGFCYEETLAVATLVFGGVLDRHPGLDVCISHGGGATAWLSERLDHAARTRPWAPDHLREPGATVGHLRRLWWDAHVGGSGSLSFLIDTFGTERLVAGTNFAGWDQSVDPSHGDAALAATFDGNARRLLRLDR